MARTQGLTRPSEVPAGGKVRSQRRCWVWEKNVVYSPSCFVRGGARFWGLVFRAFWRASWKIGEEASCRKPRHDREKLFANLQRVSPGWPVLYVGEQRCACIARACNHQRVRDYRGQPFLCARCPPGCYAVGVRVRSRAKVSRIRFGLFRREPAARGFAGFVRIGATVCARNRQRVRLASRTPSFAPFPPPGYAVRVRVRIWARFPDTGAKVRPW